MSKLTLSKYLAKIERRVPLSLPAREAFLSMPAEIQDFVAYRDIVKEGDRPHRAFFVDKGLVSRYQTLRGGERQIMSFHIAGDLVDLHSALVVIADHGVRTHCATRIVTVAHADILRAAANYPELGRAFWFDTLCDAAMFREWTINLGRRKSHERTAHLILEMAALYERAGLAENDTFEFPITQSDLSDALGMTAIHLNRVLQSLRRDRLIRTHARSITIENRAALSALAGFDPRYLHPEGMRQSNDFDGHSGGQAPGGIRQNNELDGRFERRV
ncbi:Crp/Fnr family transcriptional regulator [Sphingomonas sp.]|uniref:Crp/Fnr family transcriptional regulator n=1 Tax=Sphingomonas sp. TaxID=28214 RepID=UPI0033422356